MGHTLLTSCVGHSFFRTSLLCVVVFSFFFPSIVTHAATNLVHNGNFETPSANPAIPEGWVKGQWGTNSATFTYPITSWNGSRAAKVELHSRTSGDVKWASQLVPVTAGAMYHYEDAYESNVRTYVTVEFVYQNGTRSYVDLGRPYPSRGWWKAEYTFTVPAGVVQARVFHLINTPGFLSLENVSLTRVASDPVAFTEGMVSINFDDGKLSVYQNALPILDAAGFVSDQFITTDYLSDYYPGYIDESAVLDMQSRGHTIGAHTRTHSDLTAMSASQAQDEINGSRQVLLDLGASPVAYFAYPFGAYNDSVIQMVKDAGFAGARSSDGGLNDKATDPYALRRFPLYNSTTLTQVKDVINSAITQKKWVILLVHGVEENPGTYDITPAFLQQVVDYLKSEGITPVTVHEGVSQMK